MIEIGSRVIYRKSKHSSDPGPRAEAINPTRHGDSYGYVVDKFWVVVESSSNELVLMTRRGKRITLKPDDPNIRRAGLLERIRYRGKWLDTKTMNSAQQPGQSQ